MLILYTTDEHLTLRTPSRRTDQFIDSMIKKLDEIVRFIIKKKVSYWLSGGDFFDTAYQNCELINKVIKSLKPMADAGCKMIIIPGNHTIKGNYDVSIERSGLLTLHTMGIWKLVKDPAVLTIKGTRFILRHDDIIKTSVPWDHYTYKAFSRMCEPGDVVLVSHFHDPQGYDEVNGVRFVSPGSLGRGTGSETNPAARAPRFALMQVPDFKCKFIELKDILQSPFKISGKLKSDVDAMRGLVKGVAEGLEEFNMTTFDFPKMLDIIAKKQDLDEDVIKAIKEQYEEHRR